MADNVAISSLEKAFKVRQPEPAAPNPNSLFGAPPSQRAPASLGAGNPNAIFAPAPQEQLTPLQEEAVMGMSPEERAKAIKQFRAAEAFNALK
jgi:hypothetical protein